MDASLWFRNNFVIQVKGWKLKYEHATRIHVRLDGMCLTLIIAPSHVVAEFRRELSSVSRRLLMEAIISSHWPTLPALNLHQELSSFAMLLIVPLNGRLPHGQRYAQLLMTFPHNLKNYYDAVFPKVWIRLSLPKSPLPAASFSRTIDRQTRRPMS